MHTKIDALLALSDSRQDLSPVNLSAIVFDFDGVLVESNDVKTRAFELLYAEFGPDIRAQVVEYHLKNAGISRYRKFQHYQEQFLGRAYTESDGERLSKQFSRLVVDAIVEAPYVPGASEFLAEYSGKLSLFVASGTPDDELHEIVARRNMKRFFVSVNGSPPTKSSILRDIMDAHGLRRDQMLMVGDAMADLEGARSTGIPFLGRSINGHHPFPSDISVVPDLTNLRIWL
jgi:phosphoglycolate phosphatase-like HAD superfamily hydrolase